MPKNTHKIPHVDSYFKAKSTEEDIATSLRSIRSLQSKLNTVCVFKDQQDTFGGRAERKLPFETKKESVMNMQD